MIKDLYRRMTGLLLAAVLLTGLAVSAAAAEDTDPIPTEEPPEITAPVITMDLDDSLAVPLGGLFTLTVQASGESMQFQWYKDGALLEGQTGTTFQVNGAEVSHSGRYYCYVQNSAGAVESNGCTVTVLERPEITQDISPTALTLNVGDTITLSAQASGGNMAIHWFYKKGETEIHEIPDQTGNTLSLTAAEEHNGADFYCQFVNEAGGAITSFCHVTVNAPVPKEPPRTTKDPTGETVNEGGTALFIARAEGVSSYVWRFISASGASTYDYNNLGGMFPGLQVAGGDTDTLTLSNIPYELNGWRVACLFRGEGGETLSGAAEIQVVRTASTIQITAQPAGGTMAMDEESDFVLSVQAAASDGGAFSYQWYSADVNSAEAMKAIPGAVNSSYKPERAEGTTYYRVGVTLTVNGVTSEPVYSSTVPVTFTAAKAHEHVFSTAWEHNDLSHWHQCTCGEHADEALHTYEWTILKPPTAAEDGQQKGVCTVCGYETVQPIPAGSMPEADTQDEAEATTRRGSSWIFIVVGVLALAVIGAAVFLILRVLRTPEGEPDEEAEDETKVWDDLTEEDEAPEEESRLSAFFRGLFRR